MVIWQDLANFKRSLSFRIKQLIPRNHITETSEILSKDVVTRMRPVAWFHIGVYLRYTRIIFINPNWFKIMIILPNNGTLCSCLKMKLASAG